MFTNPTHYGIFDSQGVFVSGVSYSWEGRSLVHYLDNSTSPSLDVGYVYNESGLRIRKTVNGVEHSYTYDGDRLVYESFPNNTLRFLYDERGLLASLVYTSGGTSTRYHYVRDVTLNIFGLIDDSGNLVVRYTYDAWGNILSTTGTLASTLGVINPFRYKGYYYDSETGMYYCQTRYYVPQWCRWLSADSPKYLDVDSPEGINLFAYCANNPVKYSDRSGHMPEWAYWLIGGLIIVGALILTVATAGATAPILIGACLGAANGVVFGGLEFNSGSFSWSWEGAAKGFGWGAFTGAVGGAVGMGASSFSTTMGLSGFSKTVFQFVTNGLAATALGRIRAFAEGEKWSLARAGTAFAFGGFGSLFGNPYISSILFGQGFSVMEGMVGEIYDYYSLVALPHLFSWRRKYA